MQSQPNETADAIAAYVSETLSNHGLLSKCVAFAGDNCNTLFGGLKKGGGRNAFANLEIKALSDRGRVPCTRLKQLYAAWHRHTTN